MTSRQVFKDIYALAILGLLLASFLVVAYNVHLGGGAGVWWNTSWQYRKSITIDHTKVPANLTSFPVLIDVNDSNLAAHAQSNGSDIAFADYGGNKLSHEIESYNSSNGHLVAWVNAPSLSNTTDTILYMYYGSPTAGNQQNVSGVWDSNYKGVWHLGEISGTVNDSTVNKNNGTYTGTHQDVVGKVDGADSFNGVNEYVKGNDSSSLRITGNLTIEVWVKVNNGSPAANEYFASKYDTSSQRSYALMHSYTGYSPGQKFVLIVSSTGTTSSGQVGSGPNNVVAGTWYYVVGVNDVANQTLRIYVNGTLSGTTSYSSGLYNGSAGFSFGSLLTGGAIGNPLNGTVDEVRISNNVRSNAWISTCFNNQNNPSTFYTVGTEETQGVDTYTLTVSIVGQGSVIPNATGPYHYGDVVQLNASAATGWAFQNWTGDLSGSANPTTINMIGNKNVTATFTKNPDTVILVGTATQIGTKWAQENGATTLSDYNAFMSSVGKTDAELKAFAHIFIDNATTLNCTHWITEANAIADVLGLDHELFIAFLSGRYRGLASNFEDCTSFAIVPPATKNNEIIFHKNRDNTEEPQSAYVKYTTGLPAGQEVYKFFAEMGVADTGISYFVNDQGLAGSCDQGGSAPAKYNGLMNHYTLRYIAEHCRDVTEASAALHYLVESGFTAGATIISNYLFVDKNGNILHIADDGYSIVTEELNPQLNYGGHTYPGIYFTIDRSDASGSPEDALVQNYGNIDVKLADSTLVAKHSAMTFSTSLSGGTFLIDPTHPDALTGIFISLPAWGYSVPSLLAATSTPRALMNGTVYEFQKNHFTVTDQAFVNQTYNEWETFLNDTRVQVNLGQNVENSTNDKFLYFVSKILNPTTSTSPSIASPSPSDGAVDIGISSSELSFVLTDAQSDLINYAVSASPDIIGDMKSGTGVSSGTTIHIPITSSLQYSTLYTWQVNATDPSGSNQTTTKTFTFTTESQAVMLNPWTNGWQYRKQITIDHTKVAADLTGFPVLIELIDPGLTSKTKADGSDILFMNASGLARKLNHEIELYDGVGGHLVVWVRVPSLSSTFDTTLYMYYGNPAAGNQQNVNGVWDSGFKGVWHLGEVSGAVNDSTADGNNGTYTGSHQGVAGKLDGADSFNGVSENVVGPDSSSLRITGDLTIEAWVKVNAASPSLNEYFACKYDMNHQRSYALAHSTSGAFFLAVSLNGEAGGETGGFYDANGGTTAVVGNWYYVVGVHDDAANQLRLYVNGAFDSSGDNPQSFTSSIYSSSAQFSFGSLLNSGIGYPFSGTVDEVRISNTVRSSGWILTCFNNQNNPSSFYTFGIEETPYGSPPLVTNPSPSNGAVSVEVSRSELSFVLTDVQGNLINYSVTANPDVIGGAQSGSEVLNDTTIHIPITSSLQYSTLYTWQVQATDASFSNLTTTRTFTFTTESPPDVWWNNHWQYRKRITINHAMVQGNSPLINYPLLVDITDLNLKNKAQTNGGDIVFTDNTGVKLDHEIELFDGVGGHLVVWVRVPSLSSTLDTTLYMYYGNPAAGNQQNVNGVWDSGFKGVWHLGEVSGAVNDSTADGNNGTYTGSHQGVAGKLDGADSFNGVSENVVGPDSSSLRITGDLTIEAWVKVNAASPSLNEYFACKYDLSSKRSYALAHDSSGKFDFRISTDGTTVFQTIGATSALAGTWYHVVGVYNVSASQLRLYVNGALDGSTSFNGSIYGGTEPFSFGCLLNNGQFTSGNSFNGTVDEVRISNTVRSSGWILTCFNNQNNPNSFYTLGAEQKIADLTITGVGILENGCGIYANDLSADGSTYYYPVEVTVHNFGGLTSSLFHVKLEIYAYNGSVVETSQEISVSTLAGSASVIVNFTSLFNPTKTELYRLTATADSRNEVSWNNQTNNVLIQDNILVTVIGDLNKDGKVDILDAVAVSLAWNSTPISPQWNIKADVNHDGAVDVLDAIRLGLTWGETS